MKKVIYSKSNSLRKPQYRIRTSIVEENGVKFVEKTALCNEAVSHIDTIRSNYELAKDIYKDIKVIQYEDVDRSTIRFPYLRGKNLIHDINLHSKEEEELRSSLSSVFDKILNFKEDLIIPFFMTDAFSQMFPGCNPKEGMPAVKIANIDGIFSNFINTTDGLCLFDYEWVTDFPVPIDYLKYRCITYEIKGHFPEFDYFSEDGELLEVLCNMDEQFQFMVHGQNREYIYDTRYLKEQVNMQHRIFEMDSDIQDYKKELEEYSSKYHQALKRLRRFKRRIFNQ